MLTCQREQIAYVLPELKPLLEMHWREVSAYQDIPLQPHYEWYCTSPVLRCFTVRDAGVLVGYAIFGVSKNKHYQTSLQAVQDIVFVAPEARGSAGVRLLRFAEKELKNEGVQVIYHHAKNAHPTLALVLHRMGYEPVEVVMAKRLDKE